MGNTNLITSGFLLFLLGSAGTAAGQAVAAESPLLSPEQFTAVENSMDRALRYLVRQQNDDGSFPVNMDHAQPGITGLCLMAFLSRGHVPGTGPYGRQMDKAIEYILATQHQDGLLAKASPPRQFEWKGPSHTLHYNHSIAGLALTEAFGMTNAQLESRLNTAIARAVRYTVGRQIRSDVSPVYAGGWGYLPPPPGEFQADLSLVAWHVLFLRSAKNAGFDVPAHSVDRAMQFVDRCYHRGTGAFFYNLTAGHNEPKTNRAAVGVVTLSLSGRHDQPEVKSAGDWLLRNPWQYGGLHYDYGAYYCSQAAFQLREPYWSRIYLPILSSLLAEQQADGSWPLTPHSEYYSPVYGSALFVLTLGTPLQLLPIYQR